MTPDELLQRITPDQRLLLRAVLGAEDVARQAFEEWRDGLVIQDLPNESHRLLPLLARQMDELAPTDPLRALIRGTYRFAWVKNNLITRDAADLAAAFQREGIPVLILKGGALVRYYGDDWGARPMFDVDLLVPVDRVERAFRVMAADGWRPAGGLSTEWLASRVVPRRHSFAFSRAVDEQLDLHWHVLPESLGPAADARFWANAAELELAGTKVRALSPSDLVLHLLVHGARSDIRGQVQWVADAVHVLRAHPDAELAERLAPEARRHGTLTTVCAALEAIDVLLDEPAVRPVLRRVAATRPVPLERIALPGNGNATNSVRKVAALFLRHGGGGEGVVGRTAGLVRELLDLDQVSRPALYLSYVASDRRPSVAAFARRVGGTFVRTSRTPTIALGSEADLDFTSPATADHHAGPGWWTVDDHGLWSHGAEGRIVVDLLDRHEGDVELLLDARSYDQQPRCVQVRVNERIAAEVTVGPLDGPGDLRVCVPAALAWRFRPMEIGFLAASGRWGRRRVGVRLVRMRIRPTAPSRAPTRRESRADSRRGPG